MLAVIIFLILLGAGIGGVIAFISRSGLDARASICDQRERRISVLRDQSIARIQAHREATYSDGLDRCDHGGAAGGFCPFCDDVVKGRSYGVSATTPAPPPRTRA